MHSLKASFWFHVATGTVLFVVILAVGVSGCSTIAAPTAAADTCATNAVVLSALADRRQAGLLSPGQITAITADLAVIDPVCAGAAPPASLTGAAANAAAALATILAEARS